MVKCKPIMAALAVCAALLACESKGPESIPSEMLGVWKTSAPKYDGCYMEITKKKILFANSENYWEYIDINTIVKSEVAPGVKQSLYTIFYKSQEGKEYGFSFYYDPSNGGSIRLKNQITIKWEKLDKPSIEMMLMESG